MKCKTAFALDSHQYIITFVQYMRKRYPLVSGFKKGRYAWVNAISAHIYIQALCVNEAQ